MRHITWKQGMSSYHSQEVREREREMQRPRDSLKQLIRLPCWGCGEALGCGCHPDAHLSCPLLHLSFIASSRPSLCRVTPPPVGSRQNFNLKRLAVSHKGSGGEQTFWLLFNFPSFHEEIFHHDFQTDSSSIPLYTKISEYVQCPVRMFIFLIWQFV